MTNVIFNYLEQLGFDSAPAPTTASLFALHRAHVLRVPYECIDFHAGTVGTIEPRFVMERISRGRGGYCVQLNSAYAALLEGLGFDVELLACGVQGSAGGAQPGPGFAPHLGVGVRVDGQEWLTDIGIGDGWLEPVRFEPGEHYQGGYEMRLVSDSAGVMSMLHPQGSLAALEFRSVPADRREFELWHPYVSRSVESRLTRLFTVIQRREDGADHLAGCVLRAVRDGSVATTELDSQEAWLGVLDEVFGLPLGDFTSEQWGSLWSRTYSRHLAWKSARSQGRRS